MPRALFINRLLPISLYTTNFFISMIVESAAKRDEGVALLGDIYTYFCSMSPGSSLPRVAAYYALSTLL